MTSHPNRLWWTAVVLGWAFDFLFWGQAPGINYAVYIVLCVAGGYALLRYHGLRPARTVWIVLAGALTLAAFTAVRQEPMTAVVSGGVSLVLLGITALSYQGGRWPAYRLLDYLGGYLALLGSMLARPIGFHAQVKREQAESAPGEDRNRTEFWAFVRGVLIALPVLAVFAALLASADMVFSQRLEQVIALFRLEKLPEYIFRLAYILAGAYALAGVFLHAAYRSKAEIETGEGKPALQPFLGFTEAAVVLGSVAALFASFVAIQFQYFFGGASNIHLDGFTYAEYARRGFGELVVVAFFSLLLIQAASAATRRSTGTQRRWFSALAAAVVLLVLVMLVSAFQRLVLYESAYGFSRLRTYTHVFMIWLALLLVAVVLLEVFGRERAFALAALLATVGFTASLAVVNVDAFIVRQNLNRALHGQALDVTYLAGLSPDAVPPLAAAYRSGGFSPEVREGAGAALACYAGRQRAGEQRGDWRSFHFSRWRAEGTLQALEADLGAYTLEGEDWAYSVTAPSGAQYDCSVFWD